MKRRTFLQGLCATPIAAIFLKNGLPEMVEIDKPAEKIKVGLSYKKDEFDVSSSFVEAFDKEVRVSYEKESLLRKVIS